MSAPASYGMPKPGIVPALSVRAPWPYALAFLQKRIENRTAWRSCSYRGPLILHAAVWPSGSIESYEKRPAKSMLECHETALAMCAMAERSGRRKADDVVTMRNILELRGGAFGFSSIIDVVSGPMDFNAQVLAGRIPASQRAWYMGGFALVLGEVTPFPLVPCSGALGLFGLHKDAYAKVMALREP